MDYYVKPDMKQTLSLLLILFVVTVAIHHSSSTMNRKRYYDTWDDNNDAGNNGEGESVKAGSFRYKGLIKNDPCENKPLWFLKSQERLGKLSPFYDCLNSRRAE
ncbi:unnamed protein product [Adineta steineri]|uniref:Uncharacterized protein n=1 Tax=Adineta steineri TaxID=433720 RepID=A0A815UED6_9BILA|nr:unnamed protein product [Adineta steineri]CAF1514687.1 unnamed protein product [Adineta steineri]